MARGRSRRPRRERLKCQRPRGCLHPRDRKTQRNQSSGQVGGLRGGRCRHPLRWCVVALKHQCQLRGCRDDLRLRQGNREILRRQSTRRTRIPRDCCRPADVDRFTGTALCAGHSTAQEAIVQFSVQLHIERFPPQHCRPRPRDTTCRRPAEPLRNVPSIHRTRRRV